MFPQAAALAPVADTLNSNLIPSKIASSAGGDPGFDCDANQVDLFASDIQLNSERSEIPDELMQVKMISPRQSNENPVP